MDPALWELLEDGPDAEEVAALLRLRSESYAPPGVRIVSRFGNIATCRLPRGHILSARADPNVLSLKAPRQYAAEPTAADDGEEEDFGASQFESVPKRPAETAPTGQGVVVGVVDWGCDFAHPNFRNVDGTTRLLALWDQRTMPGRSPRAQPFDYGIVHTAADINGALARADPYEAIDYHPSIADPRGSGAHGTHVMDIAAGNGLGAGDSGVAPDADLVFVHLSQPHRQGRMPLGDSVALLEAVDLISRTAGDRPVVINLSMGRHAGSHDGSTLVEQAFDHFLRERSGRAIVQSAGNYFSRSIHVAGRIPPGGQRTLMWETDHDDKTPNEVDIWYPGRDRLSLRLRSSDGRFDELVELGERAALRNGDRRVGAVYHRRHDPNNGDHQIQVFLYPPSAAGNWEITLLARDVTDGRFHAWVERDSRCRHCQSRFDPDTSTQTTTLGTICNGFQTIAVGAYDAESDDRAMASFSSSGPTRDGRQKPDLVAPGVGVVAARSAPLDPDPSRGLLTRKSGTSMAAPHVAGTVALMFEAARRPLSIDETRATLISSTTKPELDVANGLRLGSGYLNIEAAVDEAGRLARAVKSIAQVSDSEEASKLAPRADAEDVMHSNNEFAEHLDHLADETDAEIYSAQEGDCELEEPGPPVDAVELSEMACRCTPEADVPVEFDGSPAVETVGPCPDIIVPHRLLRRGMTNPSVREAQRKLNHFHRLEIAAGRTGLVNAPLAEDCIFGSRTRNAVVSFQRHVFPGQLREHDGIVGERTWSQLDRVAALPLPVTPPVPPVPLTPPGVRPGPPLIASERLDPQHWFLSAGEIEAARGGGEDPSRTLSVSTSGNRVEPLVDGEEFMTALHRDLVATGRGDFVHFTAWRMNRRQRLVPRSGPSTSVQSVWTRAIRRGVTSRTMLFRPAGGAAGRLPGAPGPDNDDANRMLRSAGGESILDARFPAFGSQHQKTAVILREGEAVAYCGGIDLAPDRWDTRRHNSAPGRTREMWDGWHDVHARIRGPAARDIELNFRDRWNDRTFPVLIPLPVPPPTPITTPLPPVATHAGTHHVQVLRTFACRSNQYPSFAPRGEFTCLAGYLKAIGRAQSYVYLEDQYLVFDELARALAGALSRIEKLIIVVPQRTDGAPVRSFNWHQANFIRILRAAYPSKVHVYHLVQPGTRDPDTGRERPIYVHSKVLIVDDIYAAIGSPNIGRRSMTHDTEITAAVVDADIVDGVCRFARDLRRNLWGEHLNLSPSSPRIADPIAAVSEWERQARAATFRVRHHTTGMPQEEMSPIWNRLSDPDGRCPTTAGRIAAAPGDQQVADEEALVADEFETVADRLPDLSHVTSLGSFDSPPSPAEIFRAWRPSADPFAIRHYEQFFDVVGRPGAALADEPRPGDLLFRTALGLGKTNVSALATGELLAPADAFQAGLMTESRRHGLYAQVVDEGEFEHTIDDRFARRVCDEFGYLEQDTLLLRPRWTGSTPSDWSAPADDSAGEQAGSCGPPRRSRCGPGGPAREIDPANPAVPPLIYKTGDPARMHQRAIRPTVGYAQQLLNTFLAQRSAGTATCPGLTRASARRRLESLRRRMSNSNCLVVDCFFWDETDLATRMFQVCQGIREDGKIGPVTWPLLEALAPAPTPPSPPPPPPPPPLPALPTSGPFKLLTIPTSSTGVSLFWRHVTAEITSGGGFARLLDGDLRYVAVPAAAMHVIRRTRTELFGDTVRRDVRTVPLKVATNGNVFNVTHAGMIDIGIGHDPVDPSATRPIGQVVMGGRVVAGSSEPNRFHIAFTSSLAPVPMRSSAAYTFGMGDPPASADAGLGGLGPMIIGGLRFGVGNRYRAGVPTGAPATGEPSSLYRPYLVQRNNNTYAALRSRGSSVGKGVIALSRDQDIVFVLVQPDGVTGMDLDTLRDKLVTIGIDDAVFLDGSDSVLLVAGGVFHVTQGSDKEEATTIGLGFR